MHFSPTRFSKRLAVRGLAVLVLLGLTSVHAEIKEAKGRKVVVTGYCACEKCCGDWASGPNPRRDRLVSGLSIAGPRKYPLGTRVWIEGLGERIIQDRLARRFDCRYDVFFTNHADAVAFGKRELQIKVARPSTATKKPVENKPPASPVNSASSSKVSSSAKAQS